MKILTENSECFFNFPIPEGQRSANPCRPLGFWLPHSYGAMTTYVQWEFCRYHALFWWARPTIYDICQVGCFSWGHYTHSADWLPGCSKDINPASRRAQTVNQICLSRYNQQKYFSWFPFPIANCGKVFVSYSEDWITQPVYWKTYILDIKINLQYSIPLSYYR